MRDSGAPFDGEARVVSERATSGRGLSLVDALVDRWGDEHGNGNLVWSTSLPAAIQDPQATPLSCQRPQPRTPRATGIS